MQTNLLRNAALIHYLQRENQTKSAENNSAILTIIIQETSYGAQVALELITTVPQAKEPGSMDSFKTSSSTKTDLAKLALVQEHGTSISEKVLDSRRQVLNHS